MNAWTLPRLFYRLTMSRVLMGIWGVSHPYEEFFRTFAALWIYPRLQPQIPTSRGSLLNPKQQPLMFLTVVSKRTETRSSCRLFLLSNEFVKPTCAPPFITLMCTESSSEWSNHGGEKRANRRERRCRNSIITQHSDDDSSVSLYFCLSLFNISLHLLHLPPSLSLSPSVSHFI